jgi:hypothetical protein
MDDASSHVLTFVDRRLEAERFALVFGVRDPSDRDLTAFADLPEIRVSGLA